MNGGFKNKRKCLFVDLEGIDLSDSVMLGAVGINLATLVPTVSTFRTLQKTSEKSTIMPVAFVSFILHVDGTISAQITAGYSETSYNEKGFNLQKKGYVGKYGAFDPSLGKSKKILGYNFQKIDRTGKSKTDLSGTSERILYLEGEGKATEEIGFGLLGAFMIGGVIPAGFQAYPYYKAQGQLQGRIEIELPFESIHATGSYKLTEETGIAGKVAYSVTKKLKGSVEAKKILWTRTLEGKAGEDENTEQEKPDDKPDTDDQKQPDENGTEKPDEDVETPGKEFDPLKVPYTISAGQTCTVETYSNKIGSLWGYNLIGNSAIFERIWLDEKGMVIKQNLYVGSPVIGEWRALGDLNGKTIIKVYFGTVTVINSAINRAAPMKKLTGIIESGGETMENPLCLNRNKLSLKAGKTFLLQAKSGMEEYKLNASSLRFKSGNYKIASVDMDGKITAKAKGKTKITVTANGGFQAECTVVVK